MGDNVFFKDKICYNFIIMLNYFFSVENVVQP